MAWRDNGETDASRRQSSLAGRWALAAILMAFAFCALLLLTPRTWAWVSWTWIALIAPFVMMFRHRLAEQQLMHAERSRRGIRYGNKFGQWAFYDHPVLSVGLFLIVVVVPLSVVGVTFLSEPQILLIRIAGIVLAVLAPLLAFVIRALLRAWQPSAASQDRIDHDG